MNNKLILAVLIVFLVVGVVAMVRLNQTNYDVPTGENSETQKNLDENVGVQPNEQIQENNLDAGLISLNELANHDSEIDCWIVYDEKVYDITSYIPRHPGGKNKIIPNCGDPDTFTQKFTKQHGTSKVSLLMNVGVVIGDFDIMGKLKN